MTTVFHYSLQEVVPYINWLYFYHAWGVSAHPEQRRQLFEEASAMLTEMQSRYRTHAVVALFEANSDGDDLLLGQMRIPMLRQQHVAQSADKPNLCLADFVRPLQKGQKDTVGAFATTVDTTLESDFRADDYLRMMAQTLADRLAEATAEKLHETVRRQLWGYAPDEALTMSELHSERFQGIRPAVGYPSLPDTSLNFLLQELLDMKQIGIRLTESGAMKPHASVSGFMLSHPQARHFSVGSISEEQLRDYARRRGLPVEIMRRFLAANLK